MITDRSHSTTKIKISQSIEFNDCWNNILYLLIYFRNSQRRIQNPVKHLRRNILRKRLTAK